MHTRRTPVSNEEILVDQGSPGACSALLATETIPPPSWEALTLRVLLNLARRGLLKARGPNGAILKVSLVIFCHELAVISILEAIHKRRRRLAHIARHPYKLLGYRIRQAWIRKDGRARMYEPYGFLVIMRGLRSAWTDRPTLVG